MALRIPHPRPVGTDETVDKTGLATTVDLNGDGYPDVVTEAWRSASALASLSHPNPI